MMRRLIISCLLIGFMAFSCSRETFERQSLTESPEFLELVRVYNELHDLSVYEDIASNSEHTFNAELDQELATSQLIAQNEVYQQELYNISNAGLSAYQADSMKTALKEKVFDQDILSYQKYLMEKYKPINDKLTVFKQLVKQIQRDYPKLQGEELMELLKARLKK